MTRSRYADLMTAPGPSLQDRYAPHNRCFGCGPANDEGLQLKSFPGAEGDELVARFRPAPHHLAFEGIVNGGIVGALLDCHSNWCATHALMKARGLAAPPCTVTAEFHVKLRKPTPLGAELALSARPVAVQGDSVVVDATLSIAETGVVTATCRGTFVAVKEGHPAFHRW
jgi:acyl-coenzyme A thioesterase PaaI-like protein